MEFRFTPEEEAFRSEVRAFAAEESAEMVRRMADARQLGEAYPTRSERFSTRLARKGWLTMSWPKEFGGEGAGVMKQLIFNEEMASAGLPGQSVGAERVAPILMMHGSEKQRQEFLPRIARDEISFCQGFSEPGAGSDLASLQTKAVQQGDYYVVNGQKIWTSGADRADWMVLLARTDPDAPKHRGITFFLLDMKTPGITVRPLTQMTGAAGFNQVFFDHVRIPRENVVGEVNRGWYVNATFLDIERSGINRIASGRRTLDSITEYARTTERGGRRLFEDPTVRHQLVDLRIGFDIGRYLAYRVAWMQSQNIVANYEASMSKMYGSELQQRLAVSAMRILGTHGQLMPDSPVTVLGGRIGAYYLQSVSLTIMGGTSEIQRNIIAERGLGLPRGD
jgi:alkylation response protein AidB-like acyl-CoA dehydrogenase